MTRESEEKQRGRGRPKKNESRANVHTVRFSDDDEALLKHIADEEGESKSDVIRKAVKMYYNYHSKRW